MAECAEKDFVPSRAHLHPSRRPLYWTPAGLVQAQHHFFQCHTLQPAQGTMTAVSCRCKPFCWRNRGNQCCNQADSVDWPQISELGLWDIWYRSSAPSFCFLLWSCQDRDLLSKSSQNQTPAWQGAGSVSRLVVCSRVCRYLSTSDNRFGRKLSYMSWLASCNGTLGRANACGWYCPP